MVRRNRVRGRHNALQKTPGHVRIIGGRWRGRRIAVPELPGLRPTPDRVRETLFNWLAPVIAGSRCLDLFAGTGALGLEAASRGARQVVLVENDREAVRRLREAVDTLAPEACEVVQADALGWLRTAPRPFDIVFLDPPFEAGLLEAAVRALDSGGWLAPGAFVYLEAPARRGAPQLTPGWVIHRSGRAGAVGYHLALRPPAAGEGQR
ncbi:MAG TPA: 16S rRNA (guanine(966)-N(2))-methyltransferase RsmD [Steroidobacteraceae bacterium]|nr:16S rRNA (guanine(966)-N(2))-methyltransferase RsmD [Steroidobacteraceae bacterium]